MTLRMLLGLLAEATVVSVIAAWKTLLSRVEFAQGGSLLIARANIQAVSLADLDMAKQLEAELLGLGRPDDAPRLEASLMTIWEGEEPPEPRIERLARSEPQAAAQHGQIEAMQEHGVAGWTRDVAADGCALCQSWREGGRVFPVTEGMKRHPFCGCLSVPVVEKEVA